MHVDFEKLISAYESSSAGHVASAECSSIVDGHVAVGTGKPLCEHFDLTSYPTLIYGTSGTVDLWNKYSGDHTYTAMKSFIDEYFSEELEDPSMTFAKLLVKSDNEPAIVALCSEALRRLRIEGIAQVSITFTVLDETSGETVQDPSMTFTVMGETSGETVQV